MELRSEPKYETVNVTDIDIAFPGDVQSYTLRDGADTYSDGKDNDGVHVIVIQFATGGTVTFIKAHAHWIAIRPRTIRVVVPADQPAKSVTPPAQA